MSQQVETAGSRGTFSPDKVKEGDFFDFIHAGREVSGSVGMICSHNDGSVHVVHERTTGNSVCAILDKASMDDRGDKCFVTAVGQGAVFAFRPQSRPS